MHQLSTAELLRHQNQALEFTPVFASSVTRSQPADIEPAWFAEVSNTASVDTDGSARWNTGGVLGSGPGPGSSCDSEEQHDLNEATHKVVDP